MGRDRPVCLSSAALLLLFTAASTASADLWTVDIDESPAPSPEKGPPFSAHASRDPALLPYQIIGIVGAYIGSVLIVGSLLLTVGRKLRKRAETMAAQPKEMIKPLSKTFDRSPVSPDESSTRWYSPRRLREKKSAASSIRSGLSNQASPIAGSVLSFDNSVIEADRMKRQLEMERLYAAVMQQDDQKSDSQQDITPVPADVAPPQYMRRNPPRLITDDPSLRHLQAAAPGSPTTPRSPVRAIYPPGTNIPPGPTSPTSPIRAEYPSFQQASNSDLRLNRERTTSFGSIRTGASAGTGAPGTPNKLRKGLRNLKISNPIVKDSNSDGARTPLSPRFYTDPGIPPEPPTAGTMNSMNFPPTLTTPGTATFPTRYAEYELEDEEIDQVRDLPQPNPQRVSAHIYNNQPQMVTNTASTRPDPTKSVGSVSNGSLPLRELNRQYAQQQSQQVNFPLSPGHWNSRPYITSAGPVKTTFLEHSRDRLGVGPKTGLPTPYSAYMPFTPLTPVTPHLTSRAERKQRKKEERKVQTPLVEEDAVADDSELWSSGY